MPSLTIIKVGWTYLPRVSQTCCHYWVAGRQTTTLNKHVLYLISTMFQDMPDHPNPLFLETLHNLTYNGIAVSNLCLDFLTSIFVVPTATHTCWPCQWSSLHGFPQPREKTSAWKTENTDDVTCQKKPHLHGRLQAYHATSWAVSPLQVWS